MIHSTKTNDSQLPLQEKSLEALAVGLRQDQVSLLGYLDAIQAKYDELEPRIASFVLEPGRFERLRQQAAALVERFPQPDRRPPLYGVLVGVKDIIYVNGLPTRAGSKLPAKAFQEAQGALVTRLLNAGALILGKTVSAEFAYFAPGPTRNPLNLEHTPGGSSSGSVAAVAAGLVPLALGTQTIGSIIRPASFCGVVGFKPSFDRLPIDGVVLVSPSVDTLGFFTKDVAGVQFAARVLIEGWRQAPLQTRPVLGIPMGPYLDFASQAAREHFERVADAIAAEGWEVRRVQAMKNFDEIVARHRELVAAEAAIEHRVRFDEYGALYHPRTAELVRQGREISEARLDAARASRLRLREELMRLMNQHGIDLWITPSTVDVALAGLDNTGDPIMNLPWSHCGLPAVTIPSGRNEQGLTYGLQVVGKWHEDEKMLGWATELENSLKKGLT